MQTAKALLDFRQLSDPNFENKASYILACMKGNTNFPNPVPTLAELEAAISNYAEALIAAKSRDSIKISIKSQQRQKLDKILVKLSLYVNFVANGDRAIIVSSGYTASPENSSVNAGM
ncbi:MAG: hypothetical protein QM726_14160 [Chitinophagaceae bacterium]